MTIIPRILLINDDEPTSKYIRDELFLSGGYSVSWETSAKAGLESLSRNSFNVSIVSFSMQDMDGIGLVNEIKRINLDCVIITLLEAPDHLILDEIAKLGVYDFIARPVDIGKLLLVVRKGLQQYSLSISYRRQAQMFQEQIISLQKQNTFLAKRIEESTQNLTRLYEDLRNTYMRTIKVLAQTIDARDHYTHSHSQSVARFAVIIAEEMGLAAKDIETVREACELHDLGKIGIEDGILLKPSSLTDQEWQQIKRHPLIGAQILEPLTFLGNVTELVKQHHEHYDGSGYTQGLRGEDILLGARIIHLADAYESMTSERSYRRVPFSREEAITEIKKNSGTQFDPKVVDAFLRVVDKLTTAP